MHTEDTAELAPAVGELVTFESITGDTRTGVVADHHKNHTRVMDRLAPLESNNWSWSEWVPREELRP